MSRPRVTQVLPFLLPVRRWQRKRCFYFKMRRDGNRYASRFSPRLPFTVFETSENVINRNTGQPIEYQYNKLHNLRLAARRVDGITLAPGETFSFWSLVRDADRDEPYKDGLLLRDGEIVGSYGGGLCALSSMLFWMFLHTPLTVTERHGHPIEALPPSGQCDAPAGTDATVNEGWLDLRVRNDTDRTFQLLVTLQGETMTGTVTSDRPPDFRYGIVNSKLIYERVNGRIYETAGVSRVERDMHTGAEVVRDLYTNICEVRYALPDGVEVIDSDAI